MEVTIYPDSMLFYLCEESKKTIGFFLVKFKEDDLVEKIMTFLIINQRSIAVVQLKK